MKGLIGLLVTAAVGLGIYMYTLKQAAPGTGHGGDAKHQRGRREE